MAEPLFSYKVSGCSSTNFLRKCSITTAFQMMLWNFTEQPLLTRFAKKLLCGLQNKLIIGKQVQKVPKNYQMILALILLTLSMILPAGYSSWDPWLNINRWLFCPPFFRCIILLLYKLDGSQKAQENVHC